MVVGQRQILLGDFQQVTKPSERLFHLPYLTRQAKSIWQRIESLISILFSFLGGT